ncbi:unnamed protein product [Rhizophagus irregularis]|nr:unnamed protein product [Rhizophagus irregularis]
MAELANWINWRKITSSWLNSNIGQWINWSCWTKLRNLLLQLCDEDLQKANCKKKTIYYIAVYEVLYRRKEDFIIVLLI